MTLLQTSGSISLSQIGVEYGVSAGTQISMSELYRGGTKVASSYTSSQKYNTGIPNYYWNTATNTTTINIRWYDVSYNTTGGTSVTSYTTTFVSATGYPSFTNFTLYRGTLFSSTSDKGVITYNYRIYASYAVNPSVPASGAISFNNFYGQGTPRTPE